MCENRLHGILDVESCVDIPKVEGREPCVRMSSVKRENDNTNHSRS